MKKALVEILSSKKALSALFAAIAAGAMKLGWKVDSETVGIILSPIIAYILGQGIADHGKEQAKLEGEK